jgi:uncharacterized protein YcbX
MQVIFSGISTIKTFLDIIFFHGERIKNIFLFYLVKNHPIIDKIYIYPIKSCAGISCENSRLSKYGLEFDRIWLIVDRNTGNFLTQRSHPEMSLIKPTLKVKDTLWPIEDKYPLGSYHGGGELLLNAPNMPEISIGFLNIKELSEKERIKVKVWENEMSGILQSEKVDDWLSTYLNRPVSLVMKDPMDSFSIDAPLKSNSFSDQYPFLIIGNASINSLNEKLRDRGKKTVVDQKNFRANIYLTNTTPFDEDFWNSWEINGVRMKSMGQCTRCRLPNVNQDTGIPSGECEPLNTLMTFRRVDIKHPYDAVFGIHAAHSNMGKIKCGQTFSNIKFLKGWF